MNAEKSGLQQAGGRMKIMGVLTVAFGVLAIASPWVVGQSILWLVGVLVIAGGLTRMVWAFQAGSLGKGILVFLIGVLTLLAGIAVIAHPLMTSAILSVLLAVYFLADGLAEIFAGSALPAGQPGKGWLIFDGIVTLILGVMIFTGFPLSGLFAIGVLLGVKLLLAGLTMLTLGTAAGRLAQPAGQG
jgi:uncharacterized membrane protein HdeD (DUF308 family)